MFIMIVNQIQFDNNSVSLQTKRRENNEIQVRFRLAKGGGMLYPQLPQIEALLGNSVSTRSFRERSVAKRFSLK